MPNQLMSIAALIVGLISFFILYKISSKIGFSKTTLLALVFGIVIGLIFKNSTNYLVVFGTIFIKVISMMVLPLLMVSLIHSIFSMKSMKDLRTIGGKSVFWLLFQTLLASLLALALALITNLGKGSAITLVEDYVPKEVPPFTQVITDLFTNNIFTSLSDGKVIPVVFFSIIVGIAVVSISAKDEEVMKPFKDLIESMYQIVYTIVDVIIGFLPFAIVSLFSNTVANNDFATLKPMFMVILLTFIACFVHLFITGGILITTVGKLNPIKYFKKVMPATIMAFTTQSSSGTLPVYIECLTENVGVAPAISNFVGPLGTTLGMSGCAGIWPTLLAIFTMNALGQPITITQCLFIVLMTPLVSLGTAGVPGGGILIATALFIVVGLPVEVVGMFAGIDAFVDMARTMTNVGSSMVASTLVAKSENQIDLEIFNKSSK